MCSRTAHLLAPAVCYAALHPGRMRRLILLDAYLTLPDMDRPAVALAALGVVDHDWETFTEILAGIVWGWGEQTHQYAGLLRESLTWEEAKRRYPSGIQTDYYPILSRITAPTLIVHHMDAIATPVEIGRRLATEIPDARFVGLEGRSVGASLADPRMMAAVEQFLSDGEEVSSEAGPRLPSGMTAILFADIVDSTGLTERLGDAAFRAKARDLDTALRVVIREHTGMPIEGKLLGDGVLAVFTSARQAIEAALACGRAGDVSGLPSTSASMPATSSASPTQTGETTCTAAPSTSRRGSAGCRRRGRCWSRRRCGRWRGRRRACGSRTGGSRR